MNTNLMKIIWNIYHNVLKNSTLYTVESPDHSNLNLLELISISYETLINYPQLFDVSAIRTTSFLPLQVQNNRFLYFGELESLFKIFADIKPTFWIIIYYFLT